MSILKPSIIKLPADTRLRFKSIGVKNVKVEDEDDKDNLTRLPRTSIAIVIAILIATGFTIALIDVILSGNEFSKNRNLQSTIVRLAAIEMTLGNNFTDISIALDLLYNRTFILGNLFYY